MDFNTIRNITTRLISEKQPTTVNLFISDEEYNIIWKPFLDGLATPTSPTSYIHKPKWYQFWKPVQFKIKNKNWLHHARFVYGGFTFILYKLNP